MPRKAKKASAWGLGRVFKAKWRDRKTGEMRESPNYSLGYYVSGEYKTETTDTDDYGKAMQLLIDRNQSRKDGVPITDKRSTTFEDCLSLVKQDYTLKDRRQSLYRLTHTAMPKLAAFFGGWRASQITTAAVVRYQVARKEAGAASATINRECAALKRGMRLAFKAGKITTVPLMDKLPENNVRHGFFSRDEVLAIKKHLGKRYHPVLDVAYITGWRVKSELLTRKWSDVDFDNGQLLLYVGQGKDKKVGRTFMFTDELRRVLTAQREYVDKIEEKTKKKVPYVFVRSSGEPIRSFYKAWNDACAAAGLERFLHDFRRTAVRNLELAGVSRKAAMQMVGHKTEDVYRRYTIVDQAMLEDAAKRLDTFQKAMA
jgi:integrase